jgi:molybdenum cofactor synthesis domain-containing protein
VSTGNEVVDAAGPLPPGKIRDSNRHSLLAMIRQSGWEAVDLGIVGDDADAIERTFTDGAARCDALVSSGGVSVGDVDLVKVVLSKLSQGEMHSMQVAIKPAKPLAFGVLADSAVPVFGLPGNPVSALVSFELFVRPAVRQMGGHQSLDRPIVAALAEEKFGRRPDGKLHLVRVAVSVAPDGDLRARPSGEQSSHMLLAMTGANGFALIADGPGVDAGERVDVLLFDADRLADGRSGLG